MSNNGILPPAIEASSSRLGRIPRKRLRRSKNTKWKLAMDADESIWSKNWNDVSRYRYKGTFAPSSFNAADKNSARKSATVDFNGLRHTSK